MQTAPLTKGSLFIRKLIPEGLDTSETGNYFSYPRAERSEQFEEDADFAQGMYCYVHDQAKTQV